MERGGHVLKVHSLRKFFKTQLMALGVQPDYIDYMMGHTIDTYHDVQSKGVEFLRGIYASKDFGIRPKPKLSLFEQMKVMCRGMGIDPDLFRVQVTEHLDNFDILVGMIKSLSFALIVGVFCSYQGLTVEGGAENVGRATMVSVVFSIILVVVADAGLTVAFYL